jgi:hypothetical protein
VAGLGVLAKYTMIVWLPSVGLFLLATPELRRLLWRPGFWVMSVVMGLCCLPILYWNMHNGWVTFKHVQALADVDKPHIEWTGPVIYLAGQCALLLVYWFVLWVMAVVAANPLRERDPGVRYLWWMSVPMFLVFLGFSFKTGGGELNWPVTAYLSGVILAVAHLESTLEAVSAVGRRVVLTLLGFACVAGLFLIVALHEPAIIRSSLAGLAGPPTDSNLMPMRRVDPTCRLRGWHYLGSEIDRLRDELRAAGEDPIVAGTNWSLPGELGVYCSGHPQAYSIGLEQGDRHSQYDLWPGPANQPELFQGRTFLIVGAIDPRVASAFDRVEPMRLVEYFEGPHKIAIWGITVAHGFHQFPPRAAGWRERN